MQLEEITSSEGTERFTLRKGETGLWVVSDTQSDPNEDPLIYCFDTKRKAKDFQKMMIDEHCSKATS